VVGNLRTKDVGCGSPLGSHDKEEPKEQQRQEVSINLRDDNDDEMRRRQHEAKEISSSNHDSKSKNSREDDEDPRPSKRQKLPSALTVEIPVPRLTPTLTAQPKMPETRSRAEYAGTSVDGEHGHTPRTSRGDIGAMALVAEWR